MKNTGDRRRTIYDVAKAAGVSISTASNALNGTGRTNAETRERVRRVAEEIGFRPNALARGLLSKRSHAIGMLTNDTYGRLTLPMAAGVSEVLVDHGVSVFLCATNNDPRLAQLHLEALLDRQVDGIIFTATRLDLEPPVQLSRLPIPVVYVFAEGPADSVTFFPDDEQGARLAVDHLKELGRSRILHITGPRDYLAARIRAQSYHDACGDGAEAMFGEWSEEWGHEAVQTVFARPGPKPDAIFCGSDEIARGVIDALRDLNVEIPTDVAVVGFDNWEVVARQTRPPLTTIDMELKELGHRAGLAILSLSKGEPVPAGITRLPCRLVVRQSCGSPLQSD
ncbi:LacI family transcriptional regulator [Rhizobium leguminosarum bv. viciae]|uniref:LacI family DNA-binding transcriptional regulator n=1 Tax=Rhizobium leguminosarum TaxID=384 RepID=A0A7K3VP88_RHILE|nr:LacI family DNA-binding transcriptional regulator [Rhizobium leguminosarum]MBY5330567.1 LacI family transcriptional regulator [Rhizobium leguminosarum]MBY5344838.1 LacI family transcriptional regulator [Rhizobium leguminosarum]MBY5398835.1 LacI family transcriptional regulator [Rhizobium leguminosarum]NEK18694.1 LacI family DNA-binding transcriptional regulator [Rhizobium leguminosarum]NKK52394.1 LacI family DNA-binding transcriptional regulator [Rhizobium leguminosarum bv. viciae]